MHLTRGKSENGCVGSSSQVALPGEMFKMCICQCPVIHGEAMGLGNKTPNFIPTSCLGRKFSSFSSSTRVI